VLEADVDLLRRHPDPASADAVQPDRLGARLRRVRHDEAGTAAGSLICLGLEL